MRSLCDWQCMYQRGGDARDAAARTGARLVGHHDGHHVMARPPTPYLPVFVYVSTAGGSAIR